MFLRSVKPILVIDLNIASMFILYFFIALANVFIGSEADDIAVLNIRDDAHL